MADSEMTRHLTADIAQAGAQIEAILQQTRNSSPAASPVRAAVFQQVRHTATIESHWHIAWPAWPPGIRAKIAAALQKITRRLLQWYIDPIVEQQNRFNQTVVNALQLLADDLAALHISGQSPAEARQADIDRLQGQVDALSAQLRDED